MAAKGIGGLGVGVAALCATVALGATVLVGGVTAAPANGESPL